MANKKPAQRQKQPGKEHKMEPRPQSVKKPYLAAGKLKDKVAIITGGDSGIGRAIALAFAKEGADLAIVYLAEEKKDALETAKQVEKEGRRCLLLTYDIGQEKNCQAVVKEVLDKLGKIDIIVNNAAEQHNRECITQISAEQLERTFRVNIFSHFYLIKAALPHLKKGAVILNTASVTAYKGKATLLDYSATKGAIVAFTRSLALNLAEDGIRVNAVAPGPIWTPLIPATFPADKVAEFGQDTPLKRPGEPSEVAPCYVFLASDDASYITGQVIHPNGGEIVNA